MWKKIRTDNTKTLKNALERIADLERENAELKEKLEHKNCVDCFNHGSNVKLAKAIEIIKGLITPLTEKELHQTITPRQIWTMRAEQFLKEIEE